MTRYALYRVKVRWAGMAADRVRFIDATSPDDARRIALSNLPGGTVLSVRKASKRRCGSCGDWSDVLDTKNLCRPCAAWAWGEQVAPDEKGE